VARKERNLYRPGVVHDGGVPHGSIDDPVVRALVLVRPPGKALLPRDRCELHDLCTHVMLLTKLVTHVIMKGHMNEIRRAYRCVGGLVSAHRVRVVRQDPVVVQDRWRWWGRGSRHVCHPRPRPREVPLKVRYLGRVVVTAVLADDVLPVCRERSLVHIRLQLVDERRRRRHALTRPPSIDETKNYFQLTFCDEKKL
jgi:hypothetical protein